MTAQARERLIFNGEETSMASEPLEEYLKSKSDITFVSNTSTCWRGYYGTWEITDNKLYLNKLKAYIEGFKEVDLNYLFPEQNQVFANWFNGEIRIPKGELLESIHAGYASIYDTDLFLVFENGVLVRQYEVDNTEKYQERLKRREKEEREKPAREAKKKKREKMITFSAITFLVLVFIGICIGLFHLIKVGTLLAYILSASIVSGLILMLGGNLYLKLNKNIENKLISRVIDFNIIVFILLLLVGTFTGVFYLIKWGTLLAYLISVTVVCCVVYLIFILIKYWIHKKRFEMMFE